MTIKLKKKRCRQTPSKILSILGISIALLITAACSSSERAVSSDMEGEGSSSEKKYDFELPQYIPSSLVDMEGYETGSDKIVIFRNAKEGDSFEIRSAVDDKTVFTGKIRRFGNSQDGTGQFSAFQTEGEYYSYYEKSGESYIFKIDSEINELSFSNAIDVMFAKDFISNAEESICSLNEILFSYEVNEAAYKGLLNNVNKNLSRDILKSVSEKINAMISAQESSGGVMSLNSEDGNLSTSLDATIAFAELMARYAGIMENIDKGLSDKAYSSAEKAWKYYSSQKSTSKSDRAFAAAAQLYRISGEKKYEIVLSNFFDREDFEKLFLESDSIFYGSIAYLNTNKPVNINVCNNIMDLLLKNAESIAKSSSRNVYRVSSFDISELLANMIRLSTANYFIYNHEYKSIAEDHVHYLLGRNKDALNLVQLSDSKAGTENEEAVYASMRNTARYILLLAAV